MASTTHDFQRTHRYLDGAALQLLIGGAWHDATSGETFETVDPSTGRVLSRVARGGAADVDRAVAAARAAFDGPWRGVKPADRQLLLLRLAELVDRNFEELCLLDSMDMGAPIARVERARRAQVGMLRYYAGMATALHGDTIPNSLPGNILSHTTKEPVGVVGAIVPWNSPVLAALWKLGPILATGCTAVLKPAEQSPLGAVRLGELLAEAEYPPGVVNIVTGFGAEAGAALAAHPDVDKIAFTGSPETGRRIVEASAGNLKRISLELGGKSPDIIFADADLDVAVPGAAMGVFYNTGQVCSAGTRLYVQDEIYDEVVERVATFGAGLKVGDALDPGTQIGPLVSAEQLDRVSGYLDAGRDGGARVVGGGGRIVDGALGDGYFVEPTVFADVDSDMRIAREEIFGPVVSAIRFSDVEEAIAAGNDTDYGLGAGVWTRDLSTSHRVSQGLRAGSVWVNCYQAMDPAVPFGGFKQSGYGRESGREHLDELLETKAVWINVG